MFNTSAQKLVEIKGFKVADPHDPPNDAQTKTLLEGATARPLTNGFTLVQQAKLQTFRENGDPQLIAQTPECLHDAVGHTVASPAALDLRTADSRFVIQGTGFAWLHTNSILLISNEVRSVVHPDLLTTNAAPETEPDNSIHITADSFEYFAQIGLGIYRGHVQVQGTNLNSTSGILKVFMPIEKRQLESITADENVAMTYETINARADHAVYLATNGTLRLTGHPSWRSEQREGRGDELFIDRTNKVFQSRGNAWLRFPASGAASSQIFAAGLADTNTVSATNRFIELACPGYEFRTNVAWFRDGVRMRELRDDQPGGSLTCTNLTVTFAGTNELETLLAETNVVFAQDENEIRGERALYTGTNNLMEITGSPSWKSGPRDGKGDVLLADLTRGAMAVQGNALMHLPASQLGSGDPASATPETATLVAQQYTLSRTNALFEKDVFILHPQMHWACEQMTASFPIDPAAPRVITSERRVGFILLDREGREINGRCERAVYTYQVTASQTNDLMRLTGNPFLQTTNGTFRNDVIIVDRAANKVYAPGRYHLRGVAPARQDPVAVLDRNP